MPDPIYLCECGCGRPAPIAKTTRRQRGYVAGEPMRFIAGHQYKRSLVDCYCLDPASGCWTWTGKTNPNGYGHVKRHGRWHLAHRFVYEQSVGPIPAGLQLDHLCRNRACVNPAHLEPVTNAENVRRGAKAKLTAGQVREIRRSSDSRRVLAARHGVTANYISHLRAGRRWTEVQS